VSRPLTLAAAETVTTDVSLSEAPEADLVVVVGLTISAPKRELGNAISTIRRGLAQSGSAGAELVVSLGPDNPELGRPGHLLGAAAWVHSLQGSSDPLYVIDAGL
jgi:hypothetical protein